MTAFNPKQVRYIKLGRGGAWASQAIADGTLPFGYRKIDHAPCAAGDWDAVRAQLVTEGRGATSVSQALREIREYHELGADCLWVTIADGHLWWAFADPEVVWLGDRSDDLPARQRRMIGGWQKVSLDSTPLSVRSLSSALTRTASYRMTICKIDREDYLLRRIRGEADPLHKQALALLEQQQRLAAAMVRDLDWRDFEVLVDLILTRAGWRRISALGEGEVDIDLMLDHPTTGETAWVQIKTGTSQAELEDYLQRFIADGSCTRFFYICHTAKGTLSLPDPQPQLHLWQVDEVACQAIESGLFDWLMTRRT